MNIVAKSTLVYSVCTTKLAKHSALVNLRSARIHKFKLLQSPKLLHHVNFHFAFQRNQAFAHLRSASC